MRTLAALLLMTALAGCGQKAALGPQAGKELPPAPYGREVRKTADALLEPSVQAVPERSVELRRRSEPREDDPFDLPPGE
jgi:hypothetical protein